MFAVRARLKPSKIHGLGVFADEPIRKGQIIWYFHPAVDLRITKCQFARLPRRRQLELKHYAYTNKRGDRIICGDSAIFFNHADRPNCVDRTGHPGVPFPQEDVTVAKRAIRKGEELTCDYLLFDHSPPEESSFAFSKRGLLLRRRE